MYRLVPPCPPVVRSRPAVVVRVRVLDQRVVGSGRGDASGEVVRERSGRRPRLGARAGLADQPAHAVIGLLPLHAAGQQLGGLLSRRVVHGGPGPVGRRRVGGGGRLHGGFRKAPGGERVCGRVPPAVRGAGAVAHGVVAEGEGDGLRVGDRLDLLRQSAHRVVRVGGAVSGGCGQGGAVAVRVELRRGGTQSGGPGAVIGRGHDIAESVVGRGRASAGGVRRLGGPAQAVVAELRRSRRGGHGQRLARRVEGGGGGASAGGDGSRLVARVVPGEAADQILRAGVPLDQGAADAAAQLVVGGLAARSGRAGGRQLEPGRGPGEAGHPCAVEVARRLVQRTELVLGQALHRGSHGDRVHHGRQVAELVVGVAGGTAQRVGGAGDLAHSVVLGPCHRGDLLAAGRGVVGQRDGDGAAEPVGLRPRDGPVRVSRMRGLAEGVVAGGGDRPDGGLHLAVALGPDGRSGLLDEAAEGVVAVVRRVGRRVGAGGRSARGDRGEKQPAAVVGAGRGGGAGAVRQGLLHRVAGRVVLGGGGQRPVGRHGPGLPGEPVVEVIVERADTGETTRIEDRAGGAPQGVDGVFDRSPATAADGPDGMARRVVDSALQDDVVLRSVRPGDVPGGRGGRQSVVEVGVLGGVPHRVGAGRCPARRVVAVRLEHQVRRLARGAAGPSLQDRLGVLPGGGVRVGEHVADGVGRPDHPPEGVVAVGRRAPLGVRHAVVPAEGVMVVRGGPLGVAAGQILHGPRSAGARRRRTRAWSARCG